MNVSLEELTNAVQNALKPFVGAVVINNLEKAEAKARQIYEDWTRICPERESMPLWAEMNHQVRQELIECTKKNIKL